MNFKTLSLVVPAYKQEKTIIKDIKNLDQVLSTLKYKHEIIVVIDGLVDKTYTRIKNQESPARSASLPASQAKRGGLGTSVAGGRIKNLRVLGYEKNQGKGFAVKYGILKAKGNFVGFIDAGMDIDPSSINALVKSMEVNKADIVIGSKFYPGANIKYPLVRRMLSWGYKNIVHLLFGLNVRDTQVGLKLFRKEVAKKVFQKVRVKTFAFDIEALVIAKSMGFDKIYEVPIKLSLKKGTITRFNFLVIALRMLIDTVIVFFRTKTGYYNITKG